MCSCGCYYLLLGCKCGPIPFIETRMFGHSDPFGCSVTEANVGARLVKAKGQFRTNVPEAVLRIVTVLTNVAAMNEISLDTESCYICKYASDFVCSTCTLWSHEECCQSLLKDCVPKPLGDPDSVNTKSSIAEDKRNLGEILAQAYRDSSGDSHGTFVSSLVQFDEAEQPGDLQPLKLFQSSCALCKQALQRRASCV